MYFDVIKNALEYIGEHYSEENLDCKTVAEKCAYSEYHFHRLFKNIVNVSVTDYIRDKRLFVAANKLCDSDDTVLDICLLCGFDNQRTFNRVFKEKYGLPPKHFRIRGEYAGESLTTEEIFRNFYYRLQEGGNCMLKPYIVERGVMKLVGRSRKEGGSKPLNDNAEWGDWDEMFKGVPNTVDNKYYGISVNYCNCGYGDNGTSSRRDYWLCKEVGSYFSKNGVFSKTSEGNWGGWEKLCVDMETITLPATRWLYIPIRFDDPFLKNLYLVDSGVFDEVMAEHSMQPSTKAIDDLNKGNMDKKYENPEVKLEPWQLIPPVYLWGLLWLKENGYERQDFPFELEIYNLTDGYDKDKGGPGADMTLAIPMV